MFPVEITFDWPFPYYLPLVKLELIYSIIGFRFLTQLIDLDIRENYVHLGAFKFTITISPDAQLDQLVLSWMVFIPHNRLYLSNLRSTDLYVTSDDILQRRNPNATASD
jgi:hypothetical protein